MLDWLNSVSCISFILDDFNAKAVNSSQAQNTWKELFKQIHDANSTNQHDKFRVVLSAVFLSANTELCPWDGPCQSRLFPLVWYLNSERCTVNEEQQYKGLCRSLSCLVPEVLSWKYKGSLDVKHINEVQCFINTLMEPLQLTARISQHLKKAVYMLLLFLRYISAPPECFDNHIFRYLVDTMLPRYWCYCAQSNMWFKFMHYFHEARNICNVRSSDPNKSIHWYVCLPLLLLLLAACVVAIQSVL